VLISIGGGRDDPEADKLNEMFGIVKPPPEARPVVAQCTLKLDLTGEITAPDESETHGLPGGKRFSSQGIDGNDETRRERI
jgi:hypothetical protein